MRATVCLEAWISPDLHVLFRCATDGNSQETAVGHQVLGI